MSMTTSHEAQLSTKKHEQSGSLSRKLVLGTTAVALVVGGFLNVKSCEADDVATSPETISAAAMSEQTALDLIAQGPESLDPAKLESITVPEGSSLNGAVTEAADDYADEHNWDSETRNNNQGAINIATDELLSEADGPVPAGTIVTMYAGPEIYVPIDLDLYADTDEDQ